MIADILFIPLSYSHIVLWLFYLATLTQYKRWPSNKAKGHCENNLKGINTILAIIRVLMI